MRKFKTKKKRKHILIYIILFIILIKIISSFKLKSSNNLFLKNILNDSFSYKKSILLSINNSPKNLLKSIKYNNLDLYDTQYVINDTSPLVYIYNTHDKELYNNLYINNYDITFNVKMAAYLLSKELNKIGINTIVEENSMGEYLNNNNLSYNESYQASRYYLQSVMNKYPDLKLIIDLHRDAVSKEKSTVIINNLSFAKILFVVGENNEHFQDNYNLAIKLNDIIKTKYEGISRGVLTKNGTGIRGRFNQDISPNIVLIECGGEDNTIDEVINTIIAIKDMIKEYLGDING